MLSCGLVRSLYLIPRSYHPVHVAYYTLLASAQQDALPACAFVAMLLSAASCEVCG